MSIIQTAERVCHKELSNNFVFQRSLLAYVEAANIVSGTVLEIGTGSGYGVEIIASNTDKFITIDKYETNILSNDNVEFIKMNVPPLIDIPDSSFDFVITFQVIEHIKKDEEFVKEIYRVLKNKGKLIVTTPNKKMSITRNPWHIREYKKQELKDLMLNYFSNVDARGVHGNEKVMKYYEKNKENVNKIMRFDIFNLQYRLPRKSLQWIYDYMNDRNRSKMHKQDNDLSASITVDDFYTQEVNDDSLDLFYIAQK